MAVASCGRPAALARCLAALEAGSVAPGELIVVDQAPSAEARAAVTAFDGAAVTYLEQPRLGLSASRNRALAAATRPILAVIDDDCAPDPGWVRAIAGAFTHAPAPTAVTGPIMPLGPRPPGGYAVSLRESRSRVEYRGVIPPWSVGSGANFAGPCSVLRALGGWDERLGTGSPGRAAEDADLIYRILRDGGVICYEPGVVIRHDWQTLDKRRATRKSYSYGAAALCGICLRRRDPYAIRMLAGFTRYLLGGLVGSLRTRDRERLRQFAVGLAALPAGFLYGLRLPRAR